jgi:uncharacterized protein DUF5670
MPMILEAMSTPVECEKAMAGLPICRTIAVAAWGCNWHTHQSCQNGWGDPPVTGVTTADRQFAYDESNSAEKRQAGRQPEEGQMLWTIFVILLVLWLLGVVTSYTLGGFVHVLLVVAVVLAIMQLLQGRRAL